MLSVVWLFESAVVPAQWHVTIIDHFTYLLTYLLRTLTKRTLVPFTFYLTERGIMDANVTDIAETRETREREDQQSGRPSVGGGVALSTARQLLRPRPGSTRPRTGAGQRGGGRAGRQRRGRHAGHCHCCPMVQLHGSSSSKQCCHSWVFCHPVCFFWPRFGSLSAPSASLWRRRRKVDSFGISEKEHFLWTNFFTDEFCSSGFLDYFCRDSWVYTCTPWWGNDHMITHHVTGDGRPIPPLQILDLGFFGVLTAPKLVNRSDKNLCIKRCFRQYFVPPHFPPPKWPILCRVGR